MIENIIYCLRRDIESKNQDANTMVMLHKWSSIYQLSKSYSCLVMETLGSHPGFTLGFCLSCSRKLNHKRFTMVSRAIQQKCATNSIVCSAKFQIWISDNSLLSLSHDLYLFNIFWNGPVDGFRKLWIVMKPVSHQYGITYHENIYLSNASFQYSR